MFGRKGGSGKQWLGQAVDPVFQGKAYAIIGPQTEAANLTRQLPLTNLLATRDGTVGLKRKKFLLLYIDPPQDISAGVLNRPLAQGGIGGLQANGRAAGHDPVRLWSEGVVHARQGGRACTAAIHS